MSTWNHLTICTTKNSKLAQKSLRDSFGQPLYGEHILCFQEMYLKLKTHQTNPILCTLSSNVVSHFEISEDGSLTKCYSPLKYFELKGVKEHTILLQLDKTEHTIKNSSEVVCWITDVISGKRIDLDLYIRIAHRRK